MERPWESLPVSMEQEEWSSKRAGYSLKIGLDQVDEASKGRGSKDSRQEEYAQPTATYWPKDDTAWADGAGCPVLTFWIG